MTRSGDVYLGKRPGREAPAFVLGPGRHALRLVATKGQIVGTADLTP